MFVRVVYKFCKVACVNSFFFGGGDDKFNWSFFCSSLLNSTVKELLKFAYICESYHINKGGTVIIGPQHILS